MIIFCNGVFDLFHYGHVAYFKNIKEKYPNSFLLVGILNDKISSCMKRNPYYNEIQRKSLVQSCKYVDKSIILVDKTITMDFINNHKIDLVIHAFSSVEEYDTEMVNGIFSIPTKLEKIEVFPYTNGISTTSIVQDIVSNNSQMINVGKQGWDSVWEKKGMNPSYNLRVLNGHTYDGIDYNLCYKNIMYTLDIKPNEKILEIGCGAGYLSQLFSINFDYYGIDYSRSLLNKNIALTHSKVFQCQASILPFKDKWFEKCFSLNVFEYFPDKDYAFKVLEEIERVTQKSVYIVNIRSKTYDRRPSTYKYDDQCNHLTYTHYDFIKHGYTICDATYEHDSRFSVFKNL